jgi:hypothetical protein
VVTIEAGDDSGTEGPCGAEDYKKLSYLLSLRFIELLRKTYLTAPPVYSTANSSNTKSINPNPRGAKGVKRDSIS